MPRRSSKKSTTIGTILFHPVVWCIVATGLLVFSATALWKRHRNALLDDTQFLIGAEQIEVNQPPSWLEQPLNNAIFQISDSENSLLNPSIVPQTYDYLSRHPWIREVDRVEKSHAGLKVKLKYRVPTAFVEIKKNHGIPVDDVGVIVDSKILSETQYQVMRQSLMRISLRGLNVQGTSIPWQPWPDTRVPQAISLCQFLGPASKELELFRIVDDNLPSRDQHARLEVWTLNGTSVIWGSAPGLEIEGEAAPESKLAAIREFVKRKGKLSSFSQRNRVEIDVTTGSPMLVAKPKRSAEVERYRNSILK